MTIRLFLDDERYPVTDDWVIVRSFQEATEWVIGNGIPNEISFDHDLGLEKTGYDFAHWLINQHLDGNNLFPQDFKFFVHSQNPVGKKNIENLLTQFLYTIGD